MSECQLFCHFDVENTSFSFFTGKTVSYLLPLVLYLREPRNKKGFRAVIVSPTRELASQIFRKCDKFCEPRKLCPFIIDKVKKSAK